MYVMDEKTKWEEHLPLVEFSYKINYQSSICIEHFELSYSIPCRTPLRWDILEDRMLVGQEII